MRLVFVALFYAVTCCTATSQEYGLCSQVYMMNQYCSGVDATNNGFGISGPRGIPGERGLPGFVNESKVEEQIDVKMKETEKSCDAKLAQYVSVMNRTIANLKNKLNQLTATDCNAVKMKNAKVKIGTGGVFDIYGCNYKMEVVCDLTTNGGGWTVFQRRYLNRPSFDNDWKMYVRGFGNFAGDFWLGLEKLHLLTQAGEYELRIEITKQSGKVGIAEYKNFTVAGSSQNYKLTVGGFSGKGLSDELSYHNNMPFSTSDQDNDEWGTDNCAAQLKGGWWFKDCLHSNLNGEYVKNEQVYGGVLGIYWASLNSIGKTEMKFRKKE